MATLYTAKQVMNNGDYRRVRQTTPNGQVVEMRLMKGEDIPRETHGNTGQFIVLVSGDLSVTTYNDGTEKMVEMAPTDMVFIPSGTSHYVSTRGGATLTSFYSNPEHPVGTLHRTQRDATRVK